MSKQFNWNRNWKHHLAYSKQNDNPLFIFTWNWIFFLFLLFFVCLLMLFFFATASVCDIVLDWCFTHTYRPREYAQAQFISFFFLCCLLLLLLLLIHFSNPAIRLILFLIHSQSENTTTTITIIKMKKKKNFTSFQWMATNDCFMSHFHFTWSVTLSFILLFIGLAVCSFDLKMRHMMEMIWKRNWQKTTMGQHI